MGFFSAGLATAGQTWVRYLKGDKILTKIRTGLDKIGTGCIFTSMVGIFQGQDENREKSGQMGELGTSRVKLRLSQLILTHPDIS